MRLMDYLKDKGLLLILHCVCMMLLTGFLYGTGYSMDFTIVLLMFWAGIVLIWLLWDYSSRKKYFQQIEKILENIDQRYLLGELMPNAYRLEDRLYREYIRQSNKSVIERVRKIEDAQKDYRDYIESWVHEIKAPITSVALACENHKDAVTRRILQENRKIENYVDMALYYARSEEVYKDYMLQETCLNEIVREVLGRNKYYLIENKIQVQADCPHGVVTDGKWIAFILNQLVLNSTKYRREEDARIWIFTLSDPRGIRLTVKDNGVGIPQEELGRIFEKGFTGSNGREHERSTGMGLYLCKKLCKKMGLEITAASVQGQGTEVAIFFPVSTYLSKL